MLRDEMRESLNVRPIRPYIPIRGPRPRQDETPDQARLRKTGVDGTRIFIQRNGNGGFTIKGIGRTMNASSSADVPLIIAKIMEERFR